MPRVISGMGWGTGKLLMKMWENIVAFNDAVQPLNVIYILLIRMFVKNDNFCSLSCNSSSPAIEILF